MPTPPVTRSTRGRPAKAPLSENVVVEAGLRILRAEGLDAVTMRRVAAELDTGPASLYVYVGGRDDLCRAMLDRVTAQVSLEPPDPTRWREQLHALMRGMLASLEAHPGIARVAAASMPTSPNSLAVVETMLGILRAGGIDDQSAAWACDVLALIATATAIETVTYQERQDSEVEVVAGLRATFADLPAERFPNVTGLADRLTAGDGDTRFAFAVDTFVDGLIVRSERLAAGRQNRTA